jgi:hypothetical protein
MLQWLTDKLVEVEVAQKVNSLKDKHSKERTSGSHISEHEIIMVQFVPEKISAPVWERFDQ